MTRQPYRQFHRSHLAASNDHPSRRGSDGFTLIELLIVTAITPLLIGALAVSLIAILSLQPAAGHQLTDASNAQIVSSLYEHDVVSATNLTTASSSSPQCGSGTQILGLQINYGQSVISYVSVLTSSGYAIVRDLCTSGSSTPTTTFVVASDIPSAPATPTLTCSTGATNCTSAATSWVSTSGIASVTLGIPAHTGTGYNVSATPVLWNANGGGTPSAGTPLFPFTSLSATSCSAVSLNNNGILNVGTNGTEPLKIDSNCGGSVQVDSSSQLNANELVTADTALNTYQGSRRGGGGPPELFQAVGTNPLASLVAPSNPSAATSTGCTTPRFSNTTTCAPGTYATSPNINGGTFNFGAGTYVFTQPVTINSSSTVNFGAGTYWFEGGLAIESDGEGDGTANVSFGAGTYLFGNAANNTCPQINGATTCLDIGQGASATTSASGALLYIEAGAANFAGGSTTSLLGSAAYDGVAIWDAAGSGPNNPLTLANNNESSVATYGGIYNPGGETDNVGPGDVTATFLVTNTAVLTGSQLTVG